ncbi:extracellular solute-binding protein [Labrys wisconsinensis]|uniref:Microcin C transport system substrate-binding protein n=1 Tax=Labrys wisconsinensis TaxID=425677 RepID=A0ABU0J4Q7_9HYPH|nr:extracellular solute-binding protein [Labrys wisconsinensis]MDQ0468167.1 microcin C transport system substrate-binding protein [Labrys wisconsinensis]
MRVDRPETSKSGGWARLRGWAALALAGMALMAATAAPAQQQEWRYAVSLLGDLKYPESFQHFAYVNPDAPKGGALRLSAYGSFDSLNIVPVRGQAAGSIALIYQTLMTGSLDEPFSQYGEIADGVKFPEDRSSVTYRLNPKARWDDGQPITPDDVVWSFSVQKENNPQYGYYYRDVAKAQATGEHEVTFTFDKAGNRELPLIVGQLTVLPKHWWTATGPDGKPRDVTKPTLEKPLGSGAYRVKSFEAGRSVTYERVKDWWAADLPTEKGQNNFDEIRYDYFLDPMVIRQAFKAGTVDFQLENIAREWMTGYDIPAVKDGRIVKQEFPDHSSGRMQAYMFNLRRDKFKDERVRRAFNLAFDFEEMNRTLFFGLYTRIDSYFAGLDLASSGLPEGKELEILEAVKDKVPPSVFTTPYQNPVNGTEEARRANLRDALRLLKEAGWEVKDRKLTNVATGEVMTAEFMLDDASYERLALAYKPALERLGIVVTIRTIDSAQYKARVDNRDFDIIMLSIAQSQSPGNEQRQYWGSAAADRVGSDNVMGIKDPGVDALIDRVIFSSSREDLVAATKALDRVLLAHNYVVPQYRSPTWRTLRWDRFSGPAVLPDRPTDGGLLSVWWYDAAKAAKSGAAK